MVKKKIHKIAHKYMKQRYQWSFLYIFPIYIKARVDKEAFDGITLLLIIVAYIWFPYFENLTQGFQLTVHWNCVQCSNVLE